MPNHVKTQLRDAAVTACTSLTTTGANVFAARPDERPLKDTELPALTIYTDEESEEMGTLAAAGRRIIRTLELRVRGYAKSTSDIDATLDTITKEVEVALAADVTLGGKAKDLWPVSQVKDRDADGEKPTAFVEMVFVVEYHTAQGVPDVALA